MVSPMRGFGLNRHRLGIVALPQNRRQPAHPVFPISSRNTSAEDLPTVMAAIARQLKSEDKRDLAESFGMWVEGVLGPRLACSRRP